MAPLSLPAQEELATYAGLSAADPLTAYREYPQRESVRLREVVAQFLNAQAEELAIVDSASRGNNLATQMLEAPPGANVVVDSTTYPSALLPWLLRADGGLEIRRASETNGLPATDDLAALVDEKTIALSISHVCRKTGFRHDLRSLADSAHAHGALLLVDGAQSVGAVSVDVDGDGVDLMSFGAMKWLLGTPGVAFLYVRRSLIDRLRPAQAGSAGVRVKVGSKELEFQSGAQRYELSSGNWGGLGASRSGAELLASVPLMEVERRVLDLSGRLIDGLRKRGLVVHTPGERSRRAGIVAFEHERAGELHSHLREAAVDVWAWQNEQLVRADPHVYNADSDIDRFFAGLDSFES
jgi:selenocysteine lyase/cysteine desulfurase